ncbi:DUF366 family protein [Methanocaldococcus sp.]
MVKLVEYNSLTLIFPKEEIDYTGKEIEPLWAYKKFNVKKDSLVAFIGKMEVDRNNMKDLADLKRENLKVPIKSERAMNFVVEHFDTNNIKVAYLRQRLLILIAKEVIESFGIKLRRDGDDLYINNKKLSVSIASSGITSHKIHLGINISSKGAEHVDIIGLGEYLDDNKIKEVMENIAYKYAEEIDKIEKDIRKTLPLISL